MCILVSRCLLVLGRKLLYSVSFGFFVVGMVVVCLNRCCIFLCMLVVVCSVLVCVR